MLRSLLMKTSPLTFCTAALGFGTTLLVVRLFGLVPFANFTIDLAKLSLVLLLIEIVPSSFSVFHQQKDEHFKESLSSFFIVAALAAMLGVLLLVELSFFSAFSYWIYLYIVAITFQRYFDVRLQAEGRMQEFFILPLVTNLVRLAVLLAITQLFPSMNSISVLWASLSLGALASLCVLFIRHPSELVPFSHGNHLSSLRLLWGLRAHYSSYYPNIVLKRFRDAAMALVCDTLVGDRAEAGRYLLAFRGVQVVCGQLRVIEAFLNNFELRSGMAERRFRSMLVVAILGQIAAFCASVLLLLQANADASMFIVAAAASLFVYPYVWELVARSDAYAAFLPRRVTFSLFAFIAGIAITIGMAMLFVELTAPILVLAPLVGQTLASVSYIVFGRNTRGVQSNSTAMREKRE